MICNGCTRVKTLEEAAIHIIDCCLSRSKKVHIDYLIDLKNKILAYENENENDDKRCSEISNAMAKAIWGDP